MIIVHFREDDNQLTLRVEHLQSGLLWKQPHDHQ